MKLKIGMVGLGQRGSGLIRTLLHIDEARIVAVCDNYQDRVDKAISVISEKYDAPNGFTDFDILLKNGDFDANELYKLNTVAERFGNKYSKKVLVSTELASLGTRSEYIRARMEDMGIRSIDNVDEMADSEFERVLKSLWSN
jgi:hypothetical protein